MADEIRHGLTLRGAQAEVDATIHALGGYWLLAVAPGP